MEDSDQKDRQQQRSRPSRPGALAPEEEYGDYGRDQAANHGHGQVLHAVPGTDRRKEAAEEASRAFDPVGAGQRFSALDMHACRLPEQEP